MMRYAFINIAYWYYRHDKWALASIYRSLNIGLIAVFSTMVWYLLPLLFVGFCLNIASIYFQPISQLLSWYKETMPVGLDLPSPISLAILMFKWTTVVLTLFFGNSDPTLAKMARVNQKLSEIKKKLKVTTDD